MRADFRRATLCIVLSTFGLQAALAGVPAPPSLTGRIFSEDGATPLAGAEVVAVNLETEERFASGPTDVQGRYAVGDLPQGYYDVAVRTEDGWFAAERPVRIPSEGSAAVSLSVRQPQQDQTSNMPSTADQDRRRNKLGAFWASLTDPLGGPVVGSAVVVGGLGIVGFAGASFLDDDSSSAPANSPFLP